MHFPSDMHDEEYRHGLVTAQIEVDLPFQLRALRKQRVLTQPELADLAGMKQSRISKMEKPGGARFTLETLRRLAKALDVALIVRFGPFGELLGWSREFNPDAFAVPSFNEEEKLLEARDHSIGEAQAQGRLILITANNVRYKQIADEQPSLVEQVGKSVPRKPVASDDMPVPIIETTTGGVITHA
jgi:transcriptional regulator with XRE-family HTH domain